VLREVADPGWPGRSLSTESTRLHGSPLTPPSATKRFRAPLGPARRSFTAPRQEAVPLLAPYATHSASASSERRTTTRQDRAHRCWHHAIEVQGRIERCQHSSLEVSQRVRIGEGHDRHRQVLAHPVARRSSKFLRRNCLISSRSAGLGRSGRSPLSASGRRTARRNVSGLIPRSRATWAIGRWLSSASRTSRWTSSSGNFFGRDITAESLLPRGQTPRNRVSAKALAHSCRRRGLVLVDWVAGERPGEQLGIVSLALGV